MVLLDLSLNSHSKNWVRDTFHAGHPCVLSPALFMIHFLVIIYLFFIAVAHIVWWCFFPTMQVLTYMRTGVKVNGLDVASIFLGEKDLKLRHSPATIQGAIHSLDWGRLLDPSICIGLHLENWST